MSDLTISNIAGNLNVPELPGTVRGAPQSESSRNFGAYLKSAIENVNDLQNQSDTQIRKFLAGEGPDVHSVILAVNKADISFQLMMQIRNKLIQAYQEVMRMQV